MHWWRQWNKEQYQKFKEYNIMYELCILIFNKAKNQNKTKQKQ